MNRSGDALEIMARISGKDRSTLSRDLELVNDGGDQTVGMRFAGLNVPQGATIVSAYVQFRADETDTEVTSLLFGDLLGVTRGDIVGQAVAAAIVLAATVVLYRPFLALTFNRMKARSLGMKPAAAHLAMLVLIAISIVTSFQAVGTLLVFGLTHAGDDWRSDRLLLTGVVVAAGWAALISFVLSVTPGNRLPGMLFWLMGDLGDADRPLLPLAILGVALPLTMLRARDLNVATRGLLQAAAAMGNSDYHRCVVFHSLSKRSNAPGLRSGFVAGDAEVLAGFLRYRTYHGCAMPLQHQQASIAAWRDETHVRDNRRQYQRKMSKLYDHASFLGRHGRNAKRRLVASS